MDLQKSTYGAGHFSGYAGQMKMRLRALMVAAALRDVELLHEMGLLTQGSRVFAPAGVDDPARRAITLLMMAGALAADLNRLLGQFRV